MRTNFHTHTSRCGHAAGTDREYVEAAIEAGVKVLGFSDHTPYVGFDGDYYSSYRMPISTMDDYVASIESLKKEYKDDIEIHLGLETEYYPELFDGLLEYLKPYGIEYMILGQHFLGCDQYNPYSPTASSDEQYDTYARLCIEGMRTGYFSYIAHPDLVGCDKSSKGFARAMNAICEEAAQSDFPLEMNLLGLSGGRPYPSREFLEIAAKHKNKIILGRDAHFPDAFFDKETENKALKLCREYGLEVTENIKI